MHKVFPAKPIRIQYELNQWKLSSSSSEKFGLELVKVGESVSDVISSINIILLVLFIIS